MPIFITCDGCQKDLGRTVRAECDEQGLLLCPECKALANQEAVLDVVETRVLEILEGNLLSLDERDGRRLDELDKRLTEVENIIDAYLGLLSL